MPIAILLTVSALFGGAVSSAFAQARLVPIQVDYPVPPDTWEGMAAKAEVVAIVRLIDARNVENSADHPFAVMTHFRAEVLELLSTTGEHSVGNVIEIARIGGMMNARDGRRGMVTQAGFPPWAAGTTLLVFLIWYDESQSFVLPFGADAALELDRTGRAHSFGRGALVQKSKGRPFGDIVAEVRARVRR